MGDETHTSLEGQLLSYAIDRYTDDGDESETTSSDNSEATESAESEASSSDESEASSSIYSEEYIELMAQFPLWVRLALHISNAGFALFFGWLFLQTSMHLVLFPLALVCGMFVQTIVVYIIDSVYLYVSDTDH